MKQLIKLFVITLSLTFISACSSHTQTTNTKSYDMQNLSPTIEKNENGYMQNALDNFLENDWTPTVSKNRTIQKKYMKEDSINENGTLQYIDKENGFTLQEYVDKAFAYSDGKPNDENNSNVHKLEQMPVIGK